MSPDRELPSPGALKRTVSKYSYLALQVYHHSRKPQKPGMGKTGLICCGCRCSNPFQRLHWLHAEDCIRHNTVTNAHWLRDVGRNMVGQALDTAGRGIPRECKATGGNRQRRGAITVADASSASTSAEILYTIPGARFITTYGMMDSCHGQDETRHQLEGISVSAMISRHELVTTSRTPASRCHNHLQWPCSSLLHDVDRRRISIHPGAHYVAYHAHPFCPPPHH